MTRDPVTRVPRSSARTEVDHESRNSIAAQYPPAGDSDAGPTHLTTLPQQYSVIPFRSGHFVEVERSAKDEALRITGGGGRIELEVRFTTHGLVLSLEGVALHVRASDAVSVTARHIALTAEENLTLDAGNNLVQRAGGDTTLHVHGDLHSEARVQDIRARLGNVNVKANDDVRLNGERIMMNC